jgi:hypothetical protein
MAGARKSKRSNSKLRNKTRRQRGGGGGYGLTPEEKQRIMNRVAGVRSYNTIQAAEAQRPWYNRRSYNPGETEIVPVQSAAPPVKKPWWKPWGRQ